ncbi:hypothetical protein [Achromobacter sp. UBA4530]|uniref:glycine-rich domain-containing protein n=1 Tax=Achromobacter sp. UBA4530 TaxID=1945912 RepID=UPI00257DC4C7|nr:hypothetical protein [Achromobacter sp. UBA4530]
MQASNAPSKSAVPFAQFGTKNTIPVGSQIGVTPGAASFTDGFPPLTMTPLAAGGVPPYGADFNGILNFVTDGQRWAAAGGGYKYDPEFSAAISGYPKGAILLSAAENRYWLSTVNANSSNPDTGGTGWVALPAGIATSADVISGLDASRAVTPASLASLTADSTRQGLIRIATAAETLVGNETRKAISPSSLPQLFPQRGLRLFDTAGVHTWSVPNGVSRVRVTVIGGGGGGGGAFCPAVVGAAAGGGGGGMSVISLVELAGASSVVVTVGAGGSGGVSNTTVGTSGGMSSFGTFVSATGGSPAPNVSGVPGGSGGGGASGTGQLGVPGSAGSFAAVLNGVYAMSGPGGATLYGACPNAVNLTGNVTLGVNGATGFHGAGGSGGAAYNATAAGGAGGAGVVFIEW